MANIDELDKKISYQGINMQSEKEIKDWYNQRYLSLGENAWRPPEAYPVFLDYLNVVPKKKLLDIGCGVGYLLKFAEDRGLESYGIDVSEEGVKVAQKVTPNSKIMVGKGEDLKFPDNFFDYVTCLGSLEHFLNLKKGVSEMFRVAKKDALVLIVVPNANFILWKIKGEKGTIQQDLKENLFTLNQWKNIFIESGFSVIKIHQDRWYMKKIDIFSSKNPVEIIKKFTRKMAHFLLPLNYTYQLIYVLRKN
jgi:ubiquinone/menaquinone biosynthesis C-methylase UbiE